MKRPSRKRTVRRNVEELGERAQRNGRFSPPPPGHDFTKIPPGAEYVPGELMVRFAPRADGTQRTIAEKQKILKRLGGGIIKHHYDIVPGLTSVSLPPGLTVERALIIYNKADEILHAQPNYIYRIPTPVDKKPPSKGATPARGRIAFRSISPEERYHQPQKALKTGIQICLHKR